MKGEALKSAKCSDILGMDCIYIAQGRTIEEVAKTLMRHAKTDHQDYFGELSHDDVAAMEKRIEGVMA